MIKLYYFGWEPGLPTQVPCPPCHTLAGVLRYIRPFANDAVASVFDELTFAINNVRADENSPVKNEDVVLVFRVAMGG